MFDSKLVEDLLSKAQEQLQYDHQWRIGWSFEMMNMWEARKSIKAYEQGKKVDYNTQGNIQRWAHVLSVLCMSNVWCTNDRILLCEACGFHPVQLTNGWFILGNRISE